jgi:hypothetical protein
MLKNTTGSLEYLIYDQFPWPCVQGRGNINREMHFCLTTLIENHKSSNCKYSMMDFLYF